LSTGLQLVLKTVGCMILALQFIRIIGIGDGILQTIK